MNALIFSVSFIIFFSILIDTNNFIASQSPQNNNPYENRNSSGDGHCPPMALWQALKAKAEEYRITPVENVIIHHTLGVRCWNYEICSTIVKNIQNYSMGKGKCLDIKYNYLIGEDGNIYEGTGWLTAGCHTEGYNDKSVGIAFIGDFTNALPSRKALDNLRKLINCGLQTKNIIRDYKLYGARQLDSSTKSPGFELYNEIKRRKHWSQ